MSKDPKNTQSSWPEKTASMRYRPTPLTTEQDRDILALRAAYQDVHEMDLLIEQYAYMLEILQPSIAGKIAIRFLQNRGVDSSTRHPEFIQWRLSINNRFLYDRLKLNEVLTAIPTSTVFRLVKPTLKLILTECRDLVEKRNSLLQSSASFRRSVGIQAASNKKHIEIQTAQIKNMLPQVLAERNLNLDEYLDTLKQAQEMLADDMYIQPGERPQVDKYGTVNASMRRRTVKPT